MLLRQGDRGPEVERLQRLLNADGAGLSVDGIFGAGTESALRGYQNAHGLVADGICGVKTWAALTGAPMPGVLSQHDLREAAQALDVDLPAVMAVNEVESRGDGFIGRLPVVLFERHVMLRRLQLNSEVDAQRLANRWPRLVNADPGGYQGGTHENTRLAAARYLDDTCGAESASYGLFQVMGYHATRIGYVSVQEFADLMATSEAHQLGAFVAFVRSDEAILNALRDHDWPEFARRYNGPNYEINDYDTRLQAAYRRHERAA